MNVTHFASDGSEIASSNAAPSAVVTQSAFNWILRLGILAVGVLGFVYLIFLNSLATRTFELSSLRTQKMEIQKELQKWDIATTIPITLYALESSEQVQEMANIGKHEFVMIEEKGRIAMR